LYSDIILIPLNPDRFSAKGLSILKSEINNLRKQYKTNLQYKLFLNKFSGNTILSDKTLQTIFSDETQNGNALTTAVRLTQEIPNVTEQKYNLFSSVKKSTAKDDFDLITKELLEIKMEK
jgi:chromosome partitioning protein